MALLCCGLLTSTTYAGSSTKSVALFDAVNIVDSATQQVVQGSAPIGRFGHVTLFGEVTNITNPLFQNLDVNCWYLLGPGSDLANTPSVKAARGTLGPSGFAYLEFGPPLIGDQLLCRTGCAGGCARTITLKALFSK